MKKQWKPEPNKMYYYITLDGEGGKVWLGRNDKTDYDKKLIRMGNCYQRITTARRKLNQINKTLKT